MKIASRFTLSTRMKIILVISIAAIVLIGIVSATFLTKKVVMTKPVYWHVMGEKAHMSFRINPDSKTRQTFRLDVWLPTGIAAPENVSVQMVKKGGDKLRLTIPLEFETGGPDPYGFEGFDKYTYEAKGNILTEKGEWGISIVITDSKGQVHPYEKSVTLS